MYKRTLLLALFVLLLAGDANAQYNSYTVYLYDRHPDVILDSGGEFRLDRFNQDVLELEAQYIIPSLSIDNFIARVVRMTFYHVRNTKSGEVEYSSDVYLDKPTEISINLKNWKTLMIKELINVFPDDEVYYYTIYGKVKENGTEVWKVIIPRTMSK